MITVRPVNVWIGQRSFHYNQLLYLFNDQLCDQLAHYIQCDVECARLYKMLRDDRQMGLFLNVTISVFECYRQVRNKVASVYDFAVYYLRYFLEEDMY